MGIILPGGIGVGLGVTSLMFGTLNNILPHSYRFLQLVLCVVNQGPIRELSMDVACVVTFICSQSPALKYIHHTVKYPIICISMYII